MEESNTRPAGANAQAYRKRTVAMSTAEPNSIPRGNPTIMAIKAICSLTTAYPHVLCGLAVMNRQKEA
jgi:hypothetical protein